MPEEKKEEIILISFTIKKAGLGLEYVTMEELKKGSIVMLAETKRKSPFPPTSHLLNEVNRLRYFFARACGMWYDGFDEFLGSDFTLSIKKSATDKEKDEYEKAVNTLESIRIDFVSFNGSYQLGAVVQPIEGKYTKMKTPKIDEEDIIFEDMDRVLSEVKAAAQEFIQDSKYDIRSEAHDLVMRALKGNEEELAKLTSMTERDTFLFAIEQLEEKGALVMYGPELEAEINKAKHERDLEKKSSVEVMDVDQDNAKDESVIQFANSQREHSASQRGNKKSKDWSDTLMDTGEEEKAEKQPVDEDSFV